MSVSFTVVLLLGFHSLLLAVLADQGTSHDLEVVKHHHNKRQVGEDLCRLPGPLENGVYQTHPRRCLPGVNSEECQLKPNARVTVGWVLRYGCNLGYQLNSTRVASICLNWPGGARWLPSLPQCLESSYHSRFLPNKFVCGKTYRNSRSKREVDGRISKRGSWPWMVVLGHNKTNNPRDGVHWFCAGVLVTNRHVLTAANCVAPHKRRPTFLARLDDLNLDENVYDGSYPVDVEIEAGRKNIIVHPGFRKDVVFSHNIAIVKLKNNLPISDFVRPICLPTPDFKTRILTGATVYMVSWGQTNDDRENNPRKKPRFEPILHEINAKIIDHEVCNYNYRLYQQSDTPIIISEKVICAQVAVNRSCQGDAGSPLVMLYEENFYLLGIVATKYGCFDAEMFPRVFTKLSEYMDWIISTLAP